MKLTIKGGDYAWHGGLLPLAALRGHGWRFVGRYLSHDPSKDLSYEELAQLHIHGMRALLVFETIAGRALAGYDAGRADAIAAMHHATALGIHDPVIRFAVDQDVSAAAV